MPTILVWPTYIFKSKVIKFHKNNSINPPYRDNKDHYDHYYHTYDGTLDEVYLYVIFKFNSSGRPLRVWEYYIIDGKSYYSTKNSDGSRKRRFIYPNNYYFYISKIKLDDPLSSIKKDDCTTSVMIKKRWEQEIILEADPILIAVQSIERSGNDMNGVWKKNTTTITITKARLGFEITRLLNNPLKFSNQLQTPFCGQISIVLELIRRNPLWFVEICSQLYFQGSFKSRLGNDIAASAKLKKSDVYRDSLGTMSAPIWMLCATLQEYLNNSKLDANSKFHGTFNGEMKTMIKEILGYSNPIVETTIVYGEFKAIEKGANAIIGNGVAFLAIDADLLRQGGADFNFLGFPTHYVVLLESQVILANDTIEFEIFSWGDRYSFTKDPSNKYFLAGPGSPIEIDGDDVDDCMFAVIYANGPPDITIN